MAGRRPKPAALKARQGSAGNRQTAIDRENIRREKAAPSPVDPEPLEPSPELSDAGRKVWQRVVAAMADKLGKQLGDRHRIAAEQLAEVYSDWLACRGYLKKSKRTYKTKTLAGATIYRARPEVAQEADAWRRLRLMLIEFGLTPASEGRVDVAGSGSKDRLDDLLDDPAEGQ